MKKIKPVYFYFIGIAVLITLLYMMNRNINAISNTQNTKSSPAEEINRIPVPNDNIHNKLRKNPIAQKPSKGNVMSSTMEHMKQLKKEVDEHPMDTLKIRQYADFLSEAHQKNKAVFYYTKILEINPRRIDILSSLVYLYFNNEDFNNSEKYLKRILAIDKNNLDALYNLGVIYANKGEKMKARQTWNRIIKKFPASPMVQKAKNSIKML